MENTQVQGSGYCLTSGEHFSQLHHSVKVERLKLRWRKQIECCKSNGFLKCLFLLFIFPCCVFCVLLFFVLCVQCCQCLWIVHCWLPLQYSLRLVWPLLPVSLDCPLLIAPSVFSSSCVVNVASVSGLSIVDCPFCFLFVLCGQCCQCLWIVHCWLPLRFSLRLV